MAKRPAMDQRRSDEDKYKKMAELGAPPWALESERDRDSKFLQQDQRVENIEIKLDVVEEATKELGDR
eukprot:5067125-Karenia_brevis.AAC.1